MEVARGEQNHLPLRHLPEALLKQVEACFTEGAHRLGQIPTMQQFPHYSQTSCQITVARPRVCVCVWGCALIA